jgi:hypothetical protein
MQLSSGAGVALASAALSHRFEETGVASAWVIPCLTLPPDDPRSAIARQASAHNCTGRRDRQAPVKRHSMLPSAR